jgi:hypothetical protein
MNEHPFKRVTDPHGFRIEVDLEIVPLIRRLWTMGLETENSCQDNFGYVWVEFASASFAETFLTAIAKNGDAELRYIAKNACALDPNDRERLTTQYRTWEDSWLIHAVTWGDDDSEVSISISIRFPREHLSRVMAALS